MGRLRSLDGLRTFAVALVFAHHVNQLALPGGFIGVDVFFVISGFLITHLLLREYDDVEHIGLGAFYMRRLLRLYPALVVLVFVTVGIEFYDHLGQPLRDGAAALTYTTDFWKNYSGAFSLLTHTWSLAVEEQFYLVWPLLLIIALRRGWRLDRLIGALIIASIAVTFGIYHEHIGRLSQIQFLPTSHVAELGTGILLAVSVRSGKRSRVIALLSGQYAAAASLALLIAAEFWLQAKWWAFPAATIACWPIVAHLVLDPESRIAKLFAAEPLVWVGRRSYAFYLWHYPIILLLSLSIANSWEKAAIALPATLLIMAASWRLVETPFLRYKDARWHPGAAAPAPAAT